eukprot:s4758_g4.t1
MASDIFFTHVLVADVAIISAGVPGTTYRTDLAQVSVGDPLLEYCLRVQEPLWAAMVPLMLALLSVAAAADSECDELGMLLTTQTTVKDPNCISGKCVPELGKTVPLCLGCEATQVKPQGVLACGAESCRESIFLGLTKAACSGNGACVNSAFSFREPLEDAEMDCLCGQGCCKQARMYLVQNVKCVGDYSCTDAEINFGVQIAQDRWFTGSLACWNNGACHGAKVSVVSAAMSLIVHVAPNSYPASITMMEGTTLWLQCAGFCHPQPPSIDLRFANGKGTCVYSILTPQGAEPYKDVDVDCTSLTKRAN